MKIERWQNGSDAYYGQLKGLNNCKKMCQKHKECGGFTNDKSTGICGHWITGYTNLAGHPETNKECYSKYKG